MKKYVLMLAVFSSLMATGQAKKQVVEVGFHGFLGVDALVDTRSSKTSRNRHIYLYPLKANLNEAGEDLNSRGEMDLDAAHSRFGIDITGQEFKGIQTTAMIEADFLGEASGNSFFRLRHAFVRLTRDRWSLLAGQSWHPLFVPESYPGTVNANAGAPCHPLNRSPQIMLGWKASPTTQLFLYLVDQNNFRSSGFSKGSEESMIPELDLQMKWQSGGAFAEFTAGFKSLAIPESLEPMKIPVRVESFHFNTTFRYQLPSTIIKMGGTYGGNLSELVMLGGVGETADGRYKSLQTSAFWVDLQRSVKEGWQPGFFAGYTQNMGASTQITVIEALSREPEIGYIVALSPRVRYIIGPVVAGAEWLWTSAAWGDSLDTFGVPEKTSNFVNHRFLLSLRYNF
jgi:hypothetical protein